jgi:hypothetical protein
VECIARADRRPGSVRAISKITSTAVGSTACWSAARRTLGELLLTVRTAARAVAAPAHVAGHPPRRGACSAKHVLALGLGEQIFAQPVSRAPLLGDDLLRVTRRGIVTLRPAPVMPTSRQSKGTVRPESYVVVRMGECFESVPVEQL